jgi:glycosyltransferase involved in cell wall biosynthesis
MFISSIITTIGRSKLNRAVESLLYQNFPEEQFEIFVINDSGTLLPHKPWHESSRVRIINTNRRERSVARNTGASSAKGRYLHFLDDDDWMLPHAFQEFWKLTNNQEPAWLYGGAHLYDRNDNYLFNIQHGISGNGFIQTMAGEWIPLQSSLIDANVFHHVGGFNPLITGPEDIDLLRRISLLGELAEVDSIVSCIERGDDSSTTNYKTLPEISRLAREQILEQPGVYERMVSGAHSSYWYGKILRIYLTSAVWNIQRKRTFTAISRLFHASKSFIHTGRYNLSPNFWQSVFHPYKSFTFERGIREAREALQPDQTPGMRSI